MIEEPTPSWRRYDRRASIRRYLLLFAGLLVLIGSWRQLEVRYDYVVTAPWEIQDLTSRMFPPDVAYTGEIVAPMIETVHMSILGTGLAIVISVPIAYLAAENVSPHWTLTYLGKLVIAVTRSVSAIIWALIFVVMFGPGALAGVLALAIRSVGFVGKLLAEAIEEIDPTQAEAVTATGAGAVSTFVYGIVPQIKPAFIGIATYRWDINIRGATVLGLVGAGGIGLELNAAIDRLHWSSVLTILIAILIVVVVSEVVSAYLRRKVGGI